MRIFVLIPVFNRLHHTKYIIDVLRGQTLASSMRIVVIDDGSTDGTMAFLSAQPDVFVIKGDGNLWWGGAINEGLKYVHSQCPTEDDYVLFLNNDTWFARGYVQELVDASRKHGGAAVGSVIHEIDRNPPLVSIGARVNINRLAVWDLLSELSPEEARNPSAFYKVDALSGRGTLYPAMLFERYGRMHPHLLPHYMADYEVSMRFARHGVPLIVSSKAVVFSPPFYGNDVSRLGWWARLFSPRSSSNIMYRTCFYMLVGSPFQRLSAPLRIVYFSISRALSALKP
jgi:GT2 family glycosyltransferase